MRRNAATFHNTTSEAGDVLEQFRAEAGAQDLAVLNYFLAHDGSSSPSQCHRALIESGMIDASTPLTSIRRSVTTLTNRSLLEKTTDKAVGIFGRPEFCWRLAIERAPKQLNLFGGMAS